MRQVERKVIENLAARWSEPPASEELVKELEALVVWAQRYEHYSLGYLIHAPEIPDILKAEESDEG